MAAEDISPFIVAYVAANPGCGISHIQANCPEGNQPGDILAHLHELLVAGTVIRITRSEFFPGPA